MEKELEYGLKNIDKVAQYIIDNYGDVRIMTFTGDLGAGKTTLIKSLCNIMEVVDEVNSPTFSIINEYRTAKGTIMYHMDMYRLKDEDEALSIGIEDYLYSGCHALIEWPELIDHLLPGNVLRIHIRNIDNNSRKILFL